jgi:hypothetical protein
MTNTHHAIGFTAAIVFLSACAPARPAVYARAASPCAIRTPIAAALWVSSPHGRAIEGHVRQIEALTDSSENPLGDTEVAVSGPSQQSTRADSTGEFHLVNLPAGHYMVTVRHEGFPTRRDSLVIDNEGQVGDIRLRRARYPSCTSPRVITQQAPAAAP